MSLVKPTEDLLVKIEYARKKIIEFYLKHGRRFPWRETKNPYVILISELLLQKTTSEQVLRVFNNFFLRFPNVEELAKANIKEIESIIGELGLRKRARFLKELAEQIINEYKAKIPNDQENLLKLKGVGLYTANAVLSFAFEQCLPVVDTNVARVLRRYFGLKGDKPAYADKSLWKFAELVLPKKMCREYNYGILDLAASICRPREPLCVKCPLNKYCHYYNTVR